MSAVPVVLIISHSTISNMLSEVHVRSNILLALKPLTIDRFSTLPPSPIMIGPNVHIFKSYIVSKTLTKINFFMHVSYFIVPALGHILIKM